MTGQPVAKRSWANALVAIITNAGLGLMDRCRGLQEIGWKMWYNFLSSQGAPATGRDWAFLNYAFEYSDAKDRLKPADANEEKDRCSMQLYYNCARPDKVQWSGKDVLEVGSGRGGGGSYLTRKLKPKSYVALDYAEEQIKTCKLIHADVKDLSFVCGNAMELPFEDAKFDIVMNVESSHVYSDFSKFVNEVHRVLKPGGAFCWTDFRAVHKLPGIKAQLKAAGFADEWEDITDNVVQGLDVSSAEREQLISHLWQWKLPILSTIGEKLRGLVHNFAGSPGSEVYKKFAERRWEYKAAVFKKKA